MTSRIKILKYGTEEIISFCALIKKKIKLLENKAALSSSQCSECDCCLDWSTKCSTAIIEPHSFDFITKFLPMNGLHGKTKFIVAICFPFRLHKVHIVYQNDLT